MKSYKSRCDPAAHDNGITGMSVPFTYKIPSVGPEFGFYMEGLQAFALVPEPSLVALALLGAAGLPAFKLRARKP